jgi:glycosyltransferase involved in cell wall biosynthesis
MSFSVCTVAYNECEWIEACIEQFRPWGLRHLVLVSDTPWNGAGAPDDGTADIARNAGAEVQTGHWPSESAQRNWGLDCLSGSKYVLIVDADELYSESSITRLLTILEGSGEVGFRAAEMQTYWKTTEYAFSPPDRWEPPVIAIDPRATRFYKHRQVESEVAGSPERLPAAPITLHHMSWVKSDGKVLEKIRSFSHSTQMRPGWYDNVWLKWSREMEGLDVSPYGGSPMYVSYSPCPLPGKRMRAAVESIGRASGS